MSPELIGRGVFIFAGAVWFALAGIFGGLTYTQPLLIAAAAVFVLLLVFIARTNRGRSAAPIKGLARDGSGRAFGIINGLQFVAILITIATATHFHRNDLVPAVLEAIVGLHFLPLGRVFRTRMRFVVGLSMLAGSAVAFTQHGYQAVAVACDSAGVILWTAAAASAIGSRAGRANGL
jgi:hypothetical protein